jgi:hypothetical protein
LRALISAEDLDFIVDKHERILLREKNPDSGNYRRDVA